jgi:hypothetical protein
MTAKQNVQFIISINVHEKKHFLLKQIDNIQSFVKGEFMIILNCNDHMFQELKDHPLPSYVRVHPEVLNKNWDHGSLTHGIYRNMCYALEHFDFLYFFILSSRTIFYNNISINDLLQRNSKDHTPHTNLSGWHWPTFTRTKLAQHYLNKSLGMYQSAHEGIAFSVNVCKNIHNMLENNVEIKEDLFHFKKCVEEFSLQTISMNECNTENNEFGWINIGQGADTWNSVPTDPTLFVYKIWRN